MARHGGADPKQVQLCWSILGVAAASLSISALAVQRMWRELKSLWWQGHPGPGRAEVGARKRSEGEDTNPRANSLILTGQLSKGCYLDSVFECEM